MHPNKSIFQSRFWPIIPSTAYGKPLWDGLVPGGSGTGFTPGTSSTPRKESEWLMDQSQSSLESLPFQPALNYASDFAKHYSLGVDLDKTDHPNRSASDIRAAKLITTTHSKLTTSLKNTMVLSSEKRMGTQDPGYHYNISMVAAGTRPRMSTGIPATPDGSQRIGTRVGPEGLSNTPNIHTPHKPGYKTGDQAEEFWENPMFKVAKVTEDQVKQAGINLEGSVISTGLVPTHSRDLSLDPKDSLLGSSEPEEQHVLEEYYLQAQRKEKEWAGEIIVLREQTMGNLSTHQKIELEEKRNNALKACKAWRRQKEKMAAKIKARADRHSQQKNLLESTTGTNASIQEKIIKMQQVKAKKEELRELSRFLLLRTKRRKIWK